MIPSSLTLSSCSMQWNKLQPKYYRGRVKELWCSVVAMAIQNGRQLHYSHSLIFDFSVEVDQLMIKSHSVLVVARLNSSFELENASISVHGLNFQGFQLVFELFAKSASMQCHEIRLIFESSCYESPSASVNQDIAIHLCINGSRQTEIR